MTGHAFCPPSGASAWRYCPAWATANANNPQADSPAASEGREAHEVLAAMLAGNPPPDFATPEMIEGAKLAVEEIRTRMVEGQMMHVEERIDPILHLWGEDVWGTPDVWQYDYAEHVLRLIDYKFGHGFVDEMHNDQLVLYAGLILMGPVLKATGISPQALFERTRVEMTIIQPRNYEHAPVRTWSVPAMFLRPQLEALGDAAKLAREQLNTANTGDHCKYCPGRHECRALSQVNGYCIDLSNSSHGMHKPTGPKALRLATLAQAAERIKAEMTGLEAHLLALAQSGQNVPGWAVEHPAGRRVWNCEPEMVAAIGDMLGKEFRKPAVLTPAQAVKTGVAFEVLQAYTMQTKGEPHLVRCDGSEAARVFTINNQE